MSAAKSIVVGVPKEIKVYESRVGLVPVGVEELTRAGHRVLIQSGAGMGSGISDEQYAQYGAEIVPAAEPVWHEADLVVKVKEPLPEEWPSLRPGHPIANARFELSPDDVFYGRLHKPQDNPAHESASSELIGKSEFCGSCHDVVHKGRMIESAFVEWSESVYRERGVECQSCHMLHYAGQAAVGGPFRERLRRHNFPGVSVPLIPFPNLGYQTEEVEAVGDAAGAVGELDDSEYRVRMHEVDEAALERMRGEVKQRLVGRRFGRGELAGSITSSEADLLSQLSRRGEVIVVLRPDGGIEIREGAGTRRHPRTVAVAIKPKRQSKRDG